MSPPLLFSTTPSQIRRAFAEVRLAKAREARRLRRRAWLRKYSERLSARLAELRAEPPIADRRSPVTAAERPR